MNNQFDLLEFVFNFVNVNLKYNDISLTFTAGSVCLCGVCSRVIVLVLSVRMWWVRGLLRKSRVTAILV